MNRDTGKREKVCLCQYMVTVMVFHYHATRLRVGTKIDCKRNEKEWASEKKKWEEQARVRQTLLNKRTKFAAEERRDMLGKWDGSVSLMEGYSDQDRWALSQLDRDRDRREVAEDRKYREQVILELKKNRKKYGMAEAIDYWSGYGYEKSGQAPRAGKK